MIQASVPRTAPREALLLFRMPAADPVVAPWRQRHDAACKDGISAHITLMYPFALPDATKDVQPRSVTALCDAEESSSLSGSPASSSAPAPTSSIWRSVA
ncbi:MAG: hypothetical protein SOH99_03560 [Acidipropionibacterium acidipropionici]|jgi:hypothetical protein|uniref:hypothetical protein n=1 Tax=Acidipropionibacterium acidipropionici TaxID=1748 RepID=UPI00040538C1|nr:hypothetical protein [Acidipropionibacterium acidipropionici]